MVVALPAVALRAPVEAGDTAVIPYAVPRYQHLIASRSSIRSYLARFRTPFGHRLQPSIVIRDDNSPRIAREDLAALRNILAVAAVVRARTSRCVYNYGGSGRVYWDLFEFYPGNVRRTGHGLIIETAAEFGSGTSLGSFRGQPHPAYIFPENADPQLDETLLRPLLRLWRSKVRRGRGGAFRSRIFRSLEFAYYALAGLIANLRSSTDQALPFALWVAAFETLAQTGTGDVHAVDVLKMIRTSRWHDSHLTMANTAQIEYRRLPKPPKALTALPPDIRPVRVYQRLYRARNQSLHGGMASPRLLKGDARRRETHLAVAVPALYRGVLLSALAARALHRYPEARVYASQQRTFVSGLAAGRDISLYYKPYEQPLYQPCVT
jgi:hypothetical protein